MRFGPTPLAEAEGAVLAHSLRAGSRRLKKGRALTAADLAALAEAGVVEVVAARFADGDVPEDAAAGRIMAALAGETPHVTRAAPFTGRANLYAACAGILQVDADLVRALNGIDEAITLATLPDFSRVAGRQMLATVKIIPYAVPEAAVAEAVALLAGRQVFRLHPPVLRGADLILTRTPGMSDKVLEKGAAAIRTRLTALGVAEVAEQVVEHRAEALGTALAQARAELVLVLAGSATSDRGDVGPAALIAAGGHLTRFGMPVDPGNLLFLGDLGGRPVLGLPGCARSPKLNGADWVLERLVSGLPVSGEDIAAMGVGGLLKEIPSRPEPRGGGATAPRRPRIAGVLLAAGRSSRMQGRDKLLEPVAGRPLLRHVAEVLAESALDDLICVLPPDRAARAEVLAGLSATTVINPRAAEGMGTSLAAGVAALAPEVDAVLIAMADMPDIAVADIDRMLAAFDAEENRAIVRAVSPDGTPGHPVLFGRRFFEALRGLEGDTGARAVVAEHRDYVVDVALPGRAALTDLDTPEAWEAWRAGALLGHQ